MLKATEIIDIAAPYFRERPSDGLAAVIAARQYDLAGSPDIQFWTYRCPNEGRTDVYLPMTEHWRRMVVKFHPNAQAIIIDGPLDMFRRACAMCAFVQSDAFKAMTFFLDNDAFPNADLSGAAGLLRHIGVTTRPDEGETANFMPINEGVIIAKPSDEARAFFWAYVGTYEAVLGNIRVEAGGRDLRWWGGQLALNVVARRLPQYVTELPCEEWNFAPDRSRGYSYDELDRKKIIHLKGGRKKRPEAVFAYQLGRAA